MFTGIVDIAGAVTRVQNVPGGCRLEIERPARWKDLAIGASVAVNGVCLTIAALSDRGMEFDVIHETLSRTTLGTLMIGSRVNLERALRVGDRLDGHFVQGHVEGTVEVTTVEASPRERVVWFHADDSFRACIVPKGGVALDGVSLTVAAVREDEFSVALIPTTLERTTLGCLKTGDRVNLETDILARTVVHWLSTVGERGLPLGTLREAGIP